ncbi:MAG: hypothetical protein KF716_15020 [Anaerolineae bacterium]|nr:hypothetical protein [Anaerolineae bacterium]
MTINLGDFMSKSLYLSNTWYKAQRLLQGLKTIGGIIDVEAKLDIPDDQQGLCIHRPDGTVKAGRPIKIIATFKTGAGMIRWLESCKTARALLPTSQEAKQI